MHWKQKPPTKHCLVFVFFVWPLLPSPLISCFLPILALTFIFITRPDWQWLITWSIMVLLAFNENYKLLGRCSRHVSFEILRQSVRILSLALSTESDSRSNCRSCLFCSSCIPSARLLIPCRTCPISAASASVTDLEFFALLLLNWKSPRSVLASSLLSVMNDRIIFS